MAPTHLHVENLTGTEFLHTLASASVGGRTVTLVAHVAVRAWDESVLYRIGVDGEWVVGLSFDLVTAVGLYNQVLDDLAAAGGPPP